MCSVKADAKIKCVPTREMNVLRNRDGNEAEGKKQLISRANSPMKKQKQ